jgi:hypothetical protein
MPTWTTYEDMYSTLADLEEYRRQPWPITGLINIPVFALWGLKKAIGIIRQQEKSDFAGV